MKINLRWFVQALAFIGCIFFFIRVWEKSKLMLVEDVSGWDFAIVALYGILFFICFFVMGVTSYLKQRNNGTLKNEIPFFEKFLSKLRLV